MATIEHARRLAESMAEVAAGAGMPSVMLLTDLDEVLGTSVGSAVEMVETVDFLTGRHRDPRVVGAGDRGDGGDDPPRRPRA